MRPERWRLLISSEFDVPEQNHAIDENAFRNKRGVVIVVVVMAVSSRQGGCWEKKGEIKAKINPVRTTTAEIAVTPRDRILATSFVVFTGFAITLLDLGRTLLTVRGDPTSKVGREV